MIPYSTERFRVVVRGQRNADVRFRTERAAKGFMDYAITNGGARRVRLFEDGELVEDRKVA